MVSGSVDQKNTYVFEVGPQIVSETVARGFSYWSTANGDDTMVTLWNPADEEQDFVFTLFFSGGHYKYPMHLGPKATRSFNISEIIQTQVPDDEGNVIPPSIHEGSAEIAGPEGETQPILVAVDAGVYNVQKATCVPICIDCSGVAYAFIISNPFAVNVGGTTQQTFTLQFKSGTQSNATSAATWGSSNTSIGTVKAGLVAGVSAGPLNLSASLYTITQTGEVCQPEQDGIPSCGESLVSAPQAPGTSTPTVTFSPISSVAVGQTATTVATVSPSTNTSPISLSITSQASISPTGTFTQSGTFVVKGLSVGTATIAATVPNSENGTLPVGSTSFSVIPSISGGNTVWWFNGQNPASADYPTSVTLTSSAGSSTTWSVNQADVKINLSSTSGGTTTVTSSGSHFSVSPGDVSVTATANGAASAPFAMTARTPWKLSPSGTPSTVCDATYTYITNISYNVLDNLSAPITNDIFWNEVIGACQSSNSSNWGSICIATSSGATGLLTDILGGPQLTRDPVPAPKCDSPPTGTTAYEMVPQTIYVGTDVTGGGVKAQTDTLTYYLDQGAHTSIVSPPQPPQ